MAETAPHAHCHWRSWGAEAAGTALMVPAASHRGDILGDHRRGDARASLAAFFRALHVETWT